MKVFGAFALLALLSVLFGRAHANGGTLAPCKADSDCAGERKCLTINLDFDPSILFGGFSSSNLEEAAGGDCDESDDYCVCLSRQAEVFVPCTENDQCLDSERCYSRVNLCISEEQASALEDVAEDEINAVCPVPRQCPDDRQCVRLSVLGICLAKFSPSPSGEGAANEGTSENDNANTDSDDEDDEDDDSSEVCIAAKSLSHLHPDDLMYRNHFTARVLCDSFESCATPGHMVRYHGKVMMMKSYCQLVGGCKRTVMHVNSPRYRRALQVPSDTPHLSFTAFAARYTTKLEEHFLRTAVRMGL